MAPLARLPQARHPSRVNGRDPRRRRLTREASLDSSAWRSARHAVRRMARARPGGGPGERDAPGAALRPDVRRSRSASAADELAHALAEDHVSDGVARLRVRRRSRSLGLDQFLRWFASAYDTDDWIFRLLTMVQMAGVLVLALGLPGMFESVVPRRPRRQQLMVVGYVMMRRADGVQWLRAAKTGPRPRARSARSYGASRRDRPGRLGAAPVRRTRRRGHRGRRRRC